MKKRMFVVVAAIVTLFTQCDTLKNLPTNTSGGLFSLNGNWQLVTTSDNKAMEGTVVQVLPGIGDGTARSLNNNTYCIREKDALWRGLKSTGSGTFSAQILVGACDGNVLYKPATITVLTNDEIRITGSSAVSAELIQTWRRSTIQ
ncbi:MAG TPA: hypothetical protein VM843_04470 [Flavisolibacter sp.]|nr:hypothetical protein [Flavisolibacter sp.]